MYFVEIMAQRKTTYAMHIMPQTKNLIHMTITISLQT